MITMSRKYEPEEAECGWEDAAFKAENGMGGNCLIFGFVVVLFFLCTFAVSEAGRSFICAGAAAVSHLKSKSAQAQRP